VSLEPFEQQIHDQTVETARQALGEEAFDAAWAVGSTLDMGEAADRALAASERSAQTAH
jgi:hypothetical protein